MNVLVSVDIQLCQGPYLQDKQNTGFSPNAAELGGWRGTGDTHMLTGITCSHNVTHLEVPCQTLWLT